MTQLTIEDLKNTLALIPKAMILVEQAPAAFALMAKIQTIIQETIGLPAPPTPEPPAPPAPPT